MAINIRDSLTNQSTDPAVFTIVEPFFDYVMFVLLVLLFALAVRKSKGLCSQPHPAWNYPTVAYMPTAQGAAVLVPVAYHGAAAQPYQPTPACRPTCRVAKAGIHVTVMQDNTADAEQRATISSNYAGALKWLRVYRIPKNRCLYVRWDVPSTQPEFTALASELGVGYNLVQSLSISWFRVRPVSVEHHNGLPFGGVLAEVFTSMVRATAL
ncbi:hypothetical protein C8A01DRAFT_42256 [Parachaetomium inaequale]|uniref:Uncharacterized protein n=1 Tax=Parachaetomium inaequale TaxID=2588326 RepID=A0AAN6SKS1_9PEZI|nr:hypothetical protein C8A01DRAFT_42256 [Parachaetomium inaequale]